MPMNHRIDGPQLYRQYLRPICALLLLIAGTLTASAQGYKTDTVDAEAAKLSIVARNSVRDAARYTAERAKFAEFFTKAYFPMMTRTGPEELARLGDMRYKLFKDYLWASNNAQLQQDLTNLTFGTMGSIITAQNPPYHPAVRYNAVLIIGMLEEQYTGEGASASAAKPYSRATRALTMMVDTATTGNRYPPSVILGAVIGLERHAQARAALAPDAVQAMTAALLKLVNHKDPIQEMSRSAYAWLQVRAAGVLAQLGSPGSENNVHNGLLTLVSSLNSLDDRCATAAMLKKLDYKAAKLDPATTTDPLFQLARDLAASEAKRAQEYQEKRIGGGSFVPGGGVYAQSGAYGEQAQFPRRHVLDRLLDLRAGLEGVKPAVPAESQAKIDAVLAAIKPVIDAAMDKDTVELRFTAAINAMSSAVNKAVPPPVAPAEEAEADTF